MSSKKETSLSDLKKRLSKPKESESIEKIDLSDLKKEKVKKIPKIEVYVISDADLIKLFEKYGEEITWKQIVLLCGWHEKPYQMVFDCRLISTPVSKISDEQDVIEYLIQKGDLEPGNYLVKCT